MVMLLMSLLSCVGLTGETVVAHVETQVANRALDCVAPQDT